MSQSMSFDIDDEEFKKMLKTHLTKGFVNNEQACEFFYELVESRQAKIRLFKLMAGMDITPKYEIGDKVLLPIKYAPTWRFDSQLQEDLLFQGSFRAVVSSTSLVNNEVVVTFVYIDKNEKEFTDTYSVSEDRLRPDYSHFETQIQEFLDKED